MLVDEFFIYICMKIHKEWRLEIYLIESGERRRRIN